MIQLNLWSELPIQSPPPAPQIVAQLEAVRRAVEDLNTALEKTSAVTLRAWDMQIRYYLGGAGGAYAGPGLLPVVPVTKEPPVRRVYVNDVDRDHCRALLRGQKMPEPMIWERWPARNAEEKAEEGRRLAQWHSRRGVPTPLKADPFQTYLTNEAKKLSRKSGQPVEMVVKNQEFIERAKSIWDIINNLEF